MHLVAIHRMIGLPGSPVDFARMWSGKVSHIDTDKKMKATWFMPITRADILLRIAEHAYELLLLTFPMADEEKCTKGTKKAQFYVPDWNGCLGWRAN